MNRLSRFLRKLRQAFCRHAEMEFDENGEVRCRKCHKSFMG